MIVFIERSVRMHLHRLCGTESDMCTVHGIDIYPITLSTRTLSIVKIYLDSRRMVLPHKV